MSQSPVEKLEKLNKKQAELKRIHETVQVEIQASKKQLEALSSQAKKLYGTADLAELKKLYADMLADLEKKTEEYSKKLLEVEANLVKQQAILEL